MRLLKTGSTTSVLLSVFEWIPDEMTRDCLVNSLVVSSLCGIFHGTVDISTAIHESNKKRQIIPYFYKGRCATFACEQCWLLLLKEEKREHFLFNT